MSPPKAATAALSACTQTSYNNSPTAHIPPKKSSSCYCWSALKYLIILPQAPLINSYNGSLLTHLQAFNCLETSHAHSQTAAATQESCTEIFHRVLLSHRWETPARPGFLLGGRVVKLLGHADHIMSTEGPILSWPSCWNSEGGCSETSKSV